MWPNPFAQSTVVDTKIFYAQTNTGTASNNGTTSISSWQTWQKPNGCSFVYMFMIASGGGGGRPTNGAAAAGGGGGGSGGCTRLIIPAMFLPETLYIWPGSGGLGATTAGTAGAQGQPSIVACEPSTSASNVAATSTVGSYVLYQVGATGGAAATTAGTIGLAGLITDQSIASSGIWFSIAGQAGQNGAAATNGAGSAVTTHQTIITTGGSGGGNGTGAGGALTTNTGPLKQNIAGATGGVTPQNGSHGIFCNMKIEQLISRGDPIFFTGGGGGGGVTTGGTVAGNGGAGSYGCGGGGAGGSGVAGLSSGNGGNGGDGLIIIMSW